VRRELTRRVIELDPIIDEAIGESSRIRYHSPALQAAVDGLLAAIAGWRTVAVRLARLQGEAAQQETDAVLQSIPQELRSAPEQAEPTRWMADPIGMRQIYAAAAGTLLAMPAGTPSLRLVADQTAKKVLGGLSDALDGLALLVGGSAGPPSGRRLRLYVPDWLPALVNAGRAFVAIGAAAVFWIVTEWPNGASAITWTAIPVILLAPQADAAYARTMSFVAGTGLAAVCAAIILFAVLPRLSTFVGLGIAMGAYLVPVGALMAKPPWQTGMFVPMVANFVPLLAPANPQSYDTVQFYNAALAIVTGSGAAALWFRLLPPLSPTLRTLRLLALTLRDLRKLAVNGDHRSLDGWEGRIYSRVVALPDAAEPLQRAQLLTALSVGSEIIHLRRVLPTLGLGPELNAALQALAHGSSATAIARLEQLDQRLASLADSDPRTSATLRERGRILLICDALVQHHAYFDAGAVD
jgi:uncharacterized membrane protein YccC